MVGSQKNTSSSFIELELAQNDPEKLLALALICPCGLSSSRIYYLFPHSLLQKCIPCKDPLSPYFMQDSGSHPDTAPGQNPWKANYEPKMGMQEAYWE